jgi:hypothetical protein
VLELPVGNATTVLPGSMNRIGALDDLVLVVRFEPGRGFLFSE